MTSSGGKNSPGRAIGWPYIRSAGEISSICGVFFNHIAFQYLDNYNDTFILPSSVLNDNFWLLLHVIIISIGYAFCFISSFISHIYLYLYYKYKKEQKIFRIIWFFTLIALFFLLIGTILGGIWADKSWGRFWGWDPKENGALCIILWITLLLHLRILQILNNFYFSIGMVISNFIVFAAWIGVNYLNIGLHSYGFFKNIEISIFLFCIFELFYIIFFVYYYINKKIVY